MANQPKPTNEEEVSLHIQNLEPGLSKIVQYLREVILATDIEVGEHIKWNNPCFYYTGEMNPFDPKEYKREIIVFNLHKGRILLVFPSGAKINDATGFLEGDYKDGRRFHVFKDMDDAKANEKALQHIIREWLKLVEK